MKSAAVAIAALACAASACFTPSPLPYPAQRVTLGRFSFMPPDEPGWLSIPADDSTFNAARHGASLDESYALVAKLRPVEDYASDEEFLARAREALTGGPKESADGRYAMMTADVQLWKELGARCVRLANVALDRKPVRSSGSDHSMVTSAVTFFCIDPRVPTRGIMLGLSQRCDEGKEDAALGAKAEALAATLEFLDAR